MITPETIRQDIQTLNQMLPCTSCDGNHQCGACADTNPQCPWCANQTQPHCEDGRTCVNHCGTGPCSRKCQVCLRLAWTPEIPYPTCPDAK